MIMKSNVSFADVSHEQVQFDRNDLVEALILELIDNEWTQRLRDISQTANTRLVYMFSEHSRFGHSLGVAYLALLLLKKLELEFPEKVRPHRAAVAIAALLHDLGHLAPGSHTAFKSWFPNEPDGHEELAIRIVTGDTSVSTLLRETVPTLPEEVAAILREDSSLPPWTWEVLSGGGWNIDRGNWCVADSVMAGVSYGKYNIAALTEAMVLTEDNHIALRENRLDAMMHFTVSRHAMYRQIYQHRVLLSADTLNRAIVQRARDISGTLPFADETMRHALAVSSPSKLALEHVFKMRESWWRYHLMQWLDSSDSVLVDLSRRLLNRELLKTVRINPEDDIEQLRAEARSQVEALGYDPRYYLHQVSTVDVLRKEHGQATRIVTDNGTVVPLHAAEPFFAALADEGAASERSWFVMPEEAKTKLGRAR